MRRTIFGEPTLTLSEAVDELSIAESNDTRAHYFATLNHAKWVWKELVRETIWSVRQMVIHVPADHTITLPSDAGRLLSISVVDFHGNQQPVVFNPNLNTLEVSCTTQCSCGHCNGQDSLCGILDTILLRTEDVTVNDQVFTKKTWYRKAENGELFEVIESPAYNAETQEVEVVTMNRLLCALEVDKKCCIKPTAKNRELLQLYCGCFTTNCDLGNYRHEDGRTAIMPYDTDYGYWNWEANSDERIKLFSVKAQSLILSFKSDGNCEGNDLLLPEFAMDAFLLGILYRRKKFNATASNTDKKEAMYAYNGAVSKMQQYLNPIIISAFASLSGKEAKW